MGEPTFLWEIKMNYTKAKIFNLALKNLRISQTLQSTMQTDRNTIILNEYYESARDEVLKDYDWNFANAYRELTPTGNISQNPYFLYEYDYPNDCLFAREIINSSDVKIIEFEVSTTENMQKVINTNYSPAVLRYTKVMTNESFFPVEFAMALSWYLAFLSAPSISANRNLQSDCLNVYSSVLKRAKMLNAQEGYLETKEEV